MRTVKSVLPKENKAPYVACEQTCCDSWKEITCEYHPLHYSSDTYSAESLQLQSVVVVRNFCVYRHTSL
jgi:hypothetical protein